MPLSKTALKRRLLNNGTRVLIGGYLRYRKYSLNFGGHLSQWLSNKVIPFGAAA
jgi:hypothetical protein